MSIDLPTFTVRVDHNPFLAVDARSVHAVLQIAAGPAQIGGNAPSLAEVIVIDTSSSMAGTKIAEAKRAAAAAVHALRDGTLFALVAGNTTALPVYPAEAAMAVADSATRAAAADALDRVAAGGGTYLSTWLRCADRLLVDAPVELRHALLLTDGQNIEGEQPLKEALTACAGRFVCDCRGIGANWSPEQLKQIARSLNGGWKPISEPEHLTEDFEEVMNRSTRKQVADVTLRVRVAPGARIARLARVMPDIEDLTDKGCATDGKIDFPLGSWGAEVCDYHLRIDVALEELTFKPGRGEKASVGKLEVLLPGADGRPTAVAHGSVKVRWTTDIRRSAQINPRVAGYTGQEELARAVNDAISAWDRESPDMGEKLGRAVALAHEIGRDDLLEHLAVLADIEDAAAGRVTPKQRAAVKREHVFMTSWLSEQSRPVNSDGADGHQDEHG